jgi:hypothetical protein
LFVLLLFFFHFMGHSSSSCCVLLLLIVILLFLFFNVLHDYCMITVTPSLPCAMDFVNISDDTSSYDHAVVIYPPDDRQARIMFKLMMIAELETALTHKTTIKQSSTSTSAKKVAWSDRGWRRKDDFCTELECALSDGASSSSGVVIARVQTRLEAEALVAQLAASAAQVRAGGIVQPSHGRDVSSHCN